jgi:glycosyltransferase involved in cell wall biosynthesis
LKLSIIIPVYNEEETLERVLSLVEDENLPCEKEVIVVDDGSYDTSREIAANHRNVRLLCHAMNEGKGAAIKSGLRHATGDFICVQDADMEYLPADLPMLVKALVEGQDIAVFGNRLATRPKGMSLKNYVGNLVLSFLCRLLYRVAITDLMTGYKLFPKGVKKLGELDVASFGFEVEITARILKLGLEIVELPIHYKARRLGKKITWADGLMAVYYIFKYRFGLRAQRLQFLANIQKYAARHRRASD